MGEGTLRDGNDREQMTFYVLIIFEVIYPCICEVRQPFVAHFRRWHVGAYLVGIALVVSVGFNLKLDVEV